MSITISNCNDICNAPTNSSTAKMLYTFSKQSRFLKRKTMLYIILHLDAKSSMNSKAHFLPEEQGSAMAASLISLGNFLIAHLPTLIIFQTVFIQVQKKALHLEKVGKR